MKSAIFILFQLLIFPLFGAATNPPISVIEGHHLSIWGKREFTLYLPKAPRSIIIALHGCMQTGDEFVQGSHLLKYAQKYNYALLIPEQDKISNKYTCWNWFYPINQMRAGEAASIISLLHFVEKEYHLTNLPIFAMGMSAGGAMASILANIYPEIFSAISTHHGIQYKATESPFEAENVTYHGARLPAPWAATRAFFLSGGIMNIPNKMPAIIFYGAKKDEVMNPIHAEQIESEFLHLNDLLDNSLLDGSTMITKTINRLNPIGRYSSTVIRHHAHGKLLIERHMIDHLGHAWSGGDDSFSFNDPKGPDATKLTLEFFKKFGL